MVQSALAHVSLLEKHGFDDIVISVKGTDVAMTVEANRLLSKACDYPLHIGITEAGTKADGILKSAVGIGTLLMEGIGDTIRVP
jgi:(E)-4-hydroxy-3-methylbut-2-enyl-diphosphate synthase